MTFESVNNLVNRSTFKLIQLIATFVLISFVLYLSGLLSPEGQSAFFDMLKNADIRFLLLSLLVGILVNLGSSLKWYMLIRSQQLGASYWRTFAYYLVGQFYNQILPTSVGGDVVRSYELGKFSGRQADSMASVFVERYTGVLVLLLLAALAVLTQLSRLSVGFVIISIVAFAVGLGLIGWMVIDQRVYQAVRNRLTEHLPKSTLVFDKLDKLLASVDAYRNHPRAIIWAFINSLLFYALAVLNVFVTALVFELNISFSDICIATPIIMLIMNLPISIGNFGLMEGAYAGVFKLFSYDPLLGVSVALLMRLKSLFDGVMGGVLHPIFVTQKHE